ncbi:alpha-L-fucosidase [Gelidibacter japonicus]|uniref:alpha-L-fucosidase n=1 Tax=Gelidibacter japonicus TaxID=1962232 RepID=UPI002021CB36|nr:alpha-L-fucosidase [Gelidibacter japonicus]MCL8007097.1 alpha-L-fucosidase [Gelidibacter japonicus]
MKYFKIIAVLVFLVANQATAQEKLTKEERLEWFQDAKLGIFMHWGYYGVNGIGESWSLYHKQITYDDYMAQGKKFTAKNYDPEAWAKLFKKIGARYAVLTTKHHDGVALWDTKVSKLNVVEKTPAKRDLVGPLVDALRKEDLKVGLYYSLIDWSHPDYDVVFPRPDTRKDYPQKNQNQLSPWQRFLKFNHDQLKELDHRFHPDLWWFDGDWEQSSEAWQAESLKDTLLAWNPEVIVNSRLKTYGDYSTPEQGVPIVRPDGAWEFCMTMNDNWGYFPSDTNYKPVSQIIRTFVEVIASGGNLLLNIGPKPDGTIGDKEMERLEALGEWVNKHESAVFGTKAGLPYGHFYGPTMLSKDETKIYLALFDTPNNYISLKGIQNKVKSIKVVGNGQELSFERNGGAAWNNIPGILRIEVPQAKNLDANVTILEVDLEGPLKLYRGHGQAVELN